MTQSSLLATSAAEHFKDTVRSGKQRKQAGLDQVMAAERAEWFEKVIFLAKTYLASLPDGALFAIEDLRAYAVTCDLEAPHSHKTWGSVPRVLLRAGLPMEMTESTRHASSPDTRAHRVTLWRKTATKTKPAESAYPAGL